ncbi:unnamed protein product [Amoebophrya sp. A25]|nr:unnamed protein product [Amoebophrya sp. A25]|eukprot:GSA25T00007515001.1
MDAWSRLPAKEEEEGEADKEVPAMEFDLSRTICICVDTASSIGNSLESVKKALGEFRCMFELINVRVSVLFYGDFQSVKDQNVTRLLFLERNFMRRKAFNDEFDRPPPVLSPEGEMKTPAGNYEGQQVSSCRFFRDVCIRRCEVFWRRSPIGKFEACRRARTPHCLRHFRRNVRGRSRLSASCQRRRRRRS